MTRPFSARIFLLFLVLFVLGTPAEAATRTRKKKIKLDRHLDALRNSCELSVRNEGRAECQGSKAARDNCVLSCMSPECFAKVYGSSPLEAGEVDTDRAVEFRSCTRRELKRRMNSKVKEDL